MSDVLKLAAALAGDPETNGLDCFAQALVDDPEGQTITAVVTFDVKDVRYVIDKGVHVPTVQVRRAEGWLTEDTPKAVREAMVARGEARLNRAPLPFGVLEGDSDE
jgi:hypothetical protein